MSGSVFSAPGDHAMVIGPRGAPPESAQEMHVCNLEALLVAHRREYLLVAAECAKGYGEHPEPEKAAARSLDDFEGEVIAELHAQWEEDRA